MKKRLVLVLAVFLFIIAFLPLSSGAVEDKKIYDEWCNSDDYFQIGQDLYHVRLSPNDFTHLLFQRNDVSYVISEDDCQETVTYYFCFKNVSYDGERATINRYGDIEPGFKVVIYERPANAPDIEITRTFSKTTVELNEEVKVEVTLENEGRQMAQNLTYEEIIPTNFTVVRTQGMTQLGNKLRYETTIGSGYSREFSFTVKPANYSNGVFKGTAKYSYAGVNYNSTSSSTTITTSVPYKITYTLTPATVNIDVMAEFKITIENKETDDKLRVDNLYVDVSRGLTVYPESFKLRKIGPSEYVFSGEISPGKTETLSLRMKGYYTGIYPIKGYIKYFMNEHYFTDTFNKNLSIEIDKVNGIIIPNFESLRAGEPVSIRAYLENNDVDNLYYNLNATLESELFSEKIYLESISPFEQKQVFSKKYNTPYYTQEKKIPIHLNGTYQSETGERFSFGTERTLTLTPANQTFSLVQNIDKTSVERGGNVTVSVYVKNLKDDPEFNLYVKDTFPIELDVFRGKTSDTINILGMENKQAYIYKFFVPSDFPFANFNITTDLDVPSKLYHDSQSAKITVTGPLPGQNITEQNQTQDNETDDEDQEQDDDSEGEEKGFFARFWDEIMNFFRTLFD